MVNAVIPFPVQGAQTPSEEDKLVLTTAEDLLHAVSAQPVPDRLNALAAELGRALDRRHDELSAPEDEIDRET